MNSKIRMSFTLTESCRVLGVDCTTLRRWLAAAHLHPQIDRHDRRKRRLTGWHIGRLAALHDRLLPDDMALIEQSRAWVTIKRLQELEAERV